MRGVETIFVYFAYLLFVDCVLTRYCNPFFFLLQVRLQRLREKMAQEPWKSTRMTAVDNTHGDVFSQGQAW